MFRNVICLAVVGLLVCHAPLAAEPKSTRRAATPRSHSTGKRVAWTLIGAGAGFAAGLFLGLNKFDDSINSDRKVWTSALVGAAAGGVAGGLLSRNIGRTPNSRPATAASDALTIPWASAMPADAAEASALRTRLRTIDATRD